MIAFPSRFADKVAVVTGAASGIGAATARRLAAEGAALVLADLNAEGLAAMADELTGAGAPVTTRPADVSLEDEVAALIALAVSNAGIGHYGLAPDITAEQWHRVMAVDVDSVFFGAKHAIPHLRATGGNIVNTCSISGLYGDYGLLAYNTAKGAVANMTRNLAIDHAPEGVRINAVCPGGVDTPMLRRVLERWPEEYERLIPMQRPGQPDEIAGAITFLASADASYITGHLLVVDGGVTAATGQPNFDRMFRSR
jgi:meso-butanediol dehydrogenase/(S,S)-butanediol dehydrogenase/diacetyl reductase